MGIIPIKFKNQNDFLTNDWKKEYFDVICGNSLLGMQTGMILFWQKLMEYRTKSKFEPGRSGARMILQLNHASVGGF